METDRETMLAGFGRVLSDEALAALDALVPRVRWRDALPEGFLLSSAAVEAYDEAARRRLHEELATVIGAEAADAAMEYLPPLPWRVLRERGVDQLLWDYPVVC